VAQTPQSDGSGTRAGHELLVKSKTTHVKVPVTLKYIRMHALPKYRHAHNFPSLTAAESSLLKDALGYVRAVFREFPPMDWVYEYFSNRGIEERNLALKMYEAKVKNQFEPHTWGTDTEPIVVRLYEDAGSALFEIAYKYSVPISFIYTMALAKGLSSIPQTLPVDKDYLQGLLSQLEARVDAARAWITRLDELVSMPPYLRVATLLEVGKAYTDDSIATLAMLAVVIHSGQSQAQRHRIVQDIIDRLLVEGYLQVVENRKGMYVCVKKYGDEDE